MGRIPAEGEDGDEGDWSSCIYAARSAWFRGPIGSVLRPRRSLASASSAATL